MAQPAVVALVCSTLVFIYFARNSLEGTDIFVVLTRFALYSLYLYSFEVDPVHEMSRSLQYSNQTMVRKRHSFHCFLIVSVFCLPLFSVCLCLLFASVYCLPLFSDCLCFLFVSVFCTKFNILLYMVSMTIERQFVVYDFL